MDWNKLYVDNQILLLVLRIKEVPCKNELNRFIILEIRLEFSFSFSLLE